ncbi:AAA family ATPase [Pseudoflavonifractor sp. An184]|uniref:AAA family ATPase n=1 Tax=Pseudoflavonifractor sp. An184 TaxID=1965576 RepID=UPI000B3899B3|nr:AAA family ATPase [Pseudoflavonifractor sp. An184]OUP58219.1 hypothetical protein B5F19_02680 [Pseudoflavonifractor sp. An184]
MTSIDKTKDEIYAQFDEWLNGQPLWLQDAAWRIYNNKKIDEEQIKIYASMCISQSKHEDLPKYNYLEPADLIHYKHSPKLAVTTLSDISGVNALAENVSLEFSESGVTAIYGLNGAGKSGFMRIFKTLSGCPYEEPIQPNVFTDTRSAEAKCKVTVTQDGETKEEVYSLTRKPKRSLLSTCDVFDTRISNQYITSPNNVSYQPFVFTVLSELASIAEKISNYISSLKENIKERSIKLPDEFRSSAECEWLANLSKDTVIPPDCLIWDVAKENEFEKLPKQLDSEQVKQKIKSITTMKNSLAPVTEDICSAIKACPRTDLEFSYGKLIEANRRFKATEILFSKSADKQDQVSIGADDWKTLWSYAKKYYEEYLFTDSGMHFGEEGSICPLCHQQISGEIQKRVSSIDQYINGTCSHEYQSTKNAFNKLCDSLTNRSFKSETITTSLHGLLSESELQSVTYVYQKIEKLKGLSDEEQRYNMICQINLPPIAKLLCDKLESLDNEIEELQDSLKDEKKTELEQRLRQLKFQKWVFDNKEIIHRVIENLRELSILDATKQYLTTNKITTQSNKMADSLITQAYIERFTRELRLMAPGIRVKLEKAQSKKGNSPYKVSIDTGDGKRYKLEDILSEGEQRIVALAAFFADATGRDELTPIIIDDPISSLDLNYEDSATKRIVELGKERQVIVFTHRISLLVGISEACEGNNVAMKEVHIRSAMKGKGIPDFEDVYHGNVKAQLNGLKSRLLQAKELDEDSEEYRDSIGRICQQFRICVERSVEDVLLLGIVRRFHRNIRTNNMVIKLSSIEEKDCKIVDDMMSKYSFIEHSQPADATIIQYSIDEIESDIQKYIDWISEYKKRQNN